MFISQAHSFQQQARLAVTLAWVSGYTNLIAVLALGTAISHISGTTSMLGRDVVEGKWALAALAGFLLVTFLCGAVLSGLLTEHARRRGWESIYVTPMLVEAVLLGLFAIGVEVREGSVLTGPSGTYLLGGIASCAMGLQNATITRISNGVVRTTHVTGVLTDVGLEFAQLLSWPRERTGTPRTTGALSAQPGARRLVLLASVFGSFLLGAALGTIAFDTLPRWSMFPPVAFLLWLVFVDATRPIAEIEASDLVTKDFGLPPEIGVYHLRRDRDHPTGAQRLPDLTAWADRLPPRVRVVVLDLDEVTSLDSNAVHQIAGVLERMRGEHRRMVIAGLRGDQFEQLRRAGAWDDGGAACSDLEIALARALNLLDDARTAR
ncbi:MAG: DUF1275 family protein [Planctomycetota bacterium]|nr:DUF1275 family protein [Planctomycetota bacterium]